MNKTDMKNTVIALLVSLAALTGCIGSGKSKEMGPAETVEAFCNALVSGEYDEAFSFCDSLQMQSYINNIRTAFGEAARRDSSAAAIAASILKEAEIEIGETAKEQDKRLVNYTIVINEELRKDKVATMKKEEGEWKIEAITDRI